MNKNYIVYHLHDENSLCDSCTNYKLYVDRAVELNQKAICFTNHGNIYNWYEKKMYCEEKGLKYMHGIECYLTETLDENEKIRDNYHTILIAKNQKGFVELNNLIFLSTQPDHFYYKPRLSFDEFLNISDNIIKISACILSPLYKFKNSIIKDRDEGKDVSERMKKYVELCNKYDYYEIQYHQFPEQIEYNKYLYKISKMYNKPLITGTDTHALNQYKLECRKMLQYGKDIVFQNEDECDLTYKSYDELIECFKFQNSLPMDVVLEAIENTNKMADTVEEIKIDTSVKYPILYEDRDEEEVMWETLKKKLEYKIKMGIIENDPRYLENIKEEMRVFKKINMVGFMLFMSEMMTWCRENNIPTSPCRGCFTENALIYTSNNFKQIKDIKIGDKVLSQDGKWHDVINTMSYDICEDLIEFEHEKQGSLKKKYKNQCTLDHKILINRNGNIDYVKAKDLKVGDLLCSPKIKHKDIYDKKVIDLNDYNIFGFDFDDKYIYEKKPTNIAYKYSPRWIEKNIGVSSTFCKRIANGYTPSKEKGKYLVSMILCFTPFKTLDNYRRYLNKHQYKIVKINRYIKVDSIWNTFIGMMYGDGWTQKDYAIGLAVNRTTKDKINRNIFYKIADRVISNGEINEKVFVNKAKNKNLDQLFINSKILNNYITTEFFKSKKGRGKIFNDKLFNQNKNMLKCILYGLKITDGSKNVKENKICYDSTSLSLISAYRTLNNIINCDFPDSIDVRLQHIDKRNTEWVNHESYKIRSQIRKTDKNVIKENEDYWFLPITKIDLLKNQKTKVYDFTVKDNHSYTINNIIVHNSVGGSTVAYISDIIDVDPIKWNTVFSRFANEDRKEVGD